MERYQLYLGISLARRACSIEGIGELGAVLWYLDQVYILPRAWPLLIECPRGASSLSSKRARLVAKLFMVARLAWASIQNLIWAYYNVSILVQMLDRVGDPLGAEGPALEVFLEPDVRGGIIGYGQRPLEGLLVREVILKVLWVYGLFIQSYSLEVNNYLRGDILEPSQVERESLV